jgi:phosphorylcholine metabolism protein LicD
MISLNLFRNTIELFKINKLNFWVFGGFALDGIRRNITREHKDIDIYLLSADLNNFISLFDDEKFNCYKREVMYFVESVDLKIGVVLLTREDDKIIANGNKTLVKFPIDIFSISNTVSLSGVSFRIAPNEVLALDAKFSIHESDKTFGTKLKYDDSLFNQIEIIKIRD